MPSFEYQAVTTEGKNKKGFLDADSARQARQLLRDKGLLPIEILESCTKKSSKKPSFRRVSSKDLALFTQQFAALVQSAIPLEEALRVAAEQTRSKALRLPLEAVRSQILEGHSLADSLREHPHVFSSVYCSLVAAGEHSGDLGKVLMRLADYGERNQQLRNSVVQAAIYPAVLTLVSIAVIILLMAYVVPKVVAQFADTGQDLPLLTRIMISVSDFIINYGWIVLAALLTATWIWKLLLQRDRFKRFWHKSLLKLPISGGLITQLETTRLLSTLSIMLNSGCPLLDALKISQNTLHNQIIRTALLDATDKVREGQALSKAMTDSRVFPPIATYMIANGEHSGELGQSMEHAARQQETLLNGVIGVTTRLIEPLLIIIFGVLVLGIVLAILLPILQMNNLTQF